MARYTGSKCKYCRREGRKLFLKGDRCFSDRCAYERRPYPPGIHGQNRVKFTEYGIQLREKQKVKRIYGLDENQFRLFFKRAAGLKGNTGENLLFLLERRLDNVIYKLGFANSRQQARQSIKHSHFTINGTKVNIPSMLVDKGDEIAIKEKSRAMPSFIEAMQAVGRKEIPRWLSVDTTSFKGSVTDIPARTDIGVDIEERLIVELYSK
ncbi:MAG: 30S ribosomal protein S4 [Proteobacteria bacterium]|nr:30S ribosomal protein S4 [Pseudomonadota bacterium]